MNTKEFLKSSDENILKFEVSDTKDAKGNMEVATFILVGDSKKAEKKYLENLTKEQTTEQDGKLFNRAILGKTALLYELPKNSIIEKILVIIFLFCHYCIECHFSGLCDHRFWCRH